MEIASPEGLLAIVLGVLIFFGSVYFLVALNTGWRFGYWITAASFGGLMIFMSLFWISSTLGPRGEEPRWLTIGADADEIPQLELEEVTLTSPGQYPGGPWSEPEEDDPLADEIDAFNSAISNCLSVNLEETQLPTPEEQATCETAQSLLPAEEDIPRVEGMQVIVTNEVTEVAFSEEEGFLLGQAVVVPLTRDPRIVDDPDVGMPVADPFVIAGVRDPGSVQRPAMGYLVFSILWFAFHLWGLRRAERRRLSPVAA